MKTSEEYYEFVLENRRLAADPQVAKCTCSNTMCDWHGKYKECVALHRHHNDHVPVCLQPIIADKIKALAGTTEMLTVKKEPTPIEYRHYVKERDKSSFKKNIKKYYDMEAELRNSKSVKVDWKIKVRGKFCELVKQKNKKSLLELGAGAGYDSQFFMNNGLKVVAVDLSNEMVKNCREKSIEAYELDFYNLSFLNKKFDCIYAINTLLHVPKNDLCHVLNEINLVLETGGLFYMGLYGGQDTENEFVKIEVSDAPRFFAFHSDTYLKIILENYFEILDFETLDIGSGTGVNTAVDIFYSITMRKKQ
jgi:SAM-dependent methyltransferase